MSGSGRLDGKRAIVTGAASGIGRAIAERFAAEGAVVACLDRDRDRLHEVTDAGASMIGVPADIADPAAVGAAVESAISSLGGVEVVVNCAGILGSAAFLEISPEEWERVQRVNVTGALLVSQAAVRWIRTADRLERSTRSIINVSSIEGRTIVARTRPQIDYAVSKAGVHHLTKALAVELAPDRIRVNSLCPGLVATAMTRDALADPEIAGWLLDQVPLGRAGEPSDLASAALFLASDEASYITGASLVVDGGWLTG